MSKKIKLYLALIVLSILWGSNFLLTSILLRDFGVWFIVFFRSLIGALGLLFLLKLLKTSIKVNIRSFGSLVLVALTGGIIPWTLVTYSQKYLTTFQGGLINATTPMFFVILGYAFFNNKLKRTQLVGILIGFLGVGYLFKDSIFSYSLLSFSLALIASVSYALTMLISREYLQNVNNLVISFNTVFLTSVVCGLIVVFQGNIPLNLIVDKTNIISFLLLGLFSSGIGYAIFFYLATEGKIGFVSLVTYLIPIVAMVLGVLVLNEEVSTKLIVGSIIVLFGIILTENTNKLNEKNNLQ